MTDLQFWSRVIHQLVCLLWTFSCLGGLFSMLISLGLENQILFGYGFLICMGALLLALINRFLIRPLWDSFTQEV